MERVLEAAEPEEKPEQPQQPAPVQQAITFAPELSITVQGDVKDPRQLATELMPHLQRLFDDFKNRQARLDLFDAAHV